MLLTNDKSNRNLYILIIGAYILLYMGTLWYRPLFTPDEIRYAEIPRAILADNDWVVPRFCGLRYFEKPIMGYWLTAISFMIFGQNEFSVRFSSAIAAGLSGLLLFWVVRRYKGADAAIKTAMIFLTCALVFGVGTFAVLDSPFSLFVTASLLIFYLAAQEPRMWPRMAWLALFGVCCGAAFLTKGFLAFVLPLIVFVPFMFWEKRWKELFMMAPVPIITALLVILPWSLAIAGREPDFWHYFVIVEHWERMFKDNSSQHPQPFWFFIPVIIGGTLPWTLIVPAILSKLGFRMPRDSFSRYCWCWLVFPFIFFSAASGKLGTYILPCYPALAYLLYAGIKNYFEDGRTRWFDLTCRHVGIVVMATAGVYAVYQLLCDLGIIQMLLYPLFPALDGAPLAPYGTGESWKWILAVAAVAAWGMGMFQAAKASDQNKKFIFFLGATLPIMLVLHFIAPQIVIHNKAPGPFIQEKAMPLLRDGDIIVGYNNVLPAICWYLKRTDDVFMFHKGGEMGYGLRYPDAAHRLISIEAFPELLRQPRKGRVVYMIKTRTFREMVPPGDFEFFEPDKDRIMISIYE